MPAFRQVLCSKKEQIVSAKSTAGTVGLSLHSSGTSTMAGPARSAVLQRC